MDLSGRPLVDTKVDRPLYLHRPVHDELVRLAERKTNTLLLGQRGSGKTTLLNHVAGDLERSGIGTVVVDGRLVDSTAGFLRLLGVQLAPGVQEPMEWSNLNRVAGITRDEVETSLDALHRIAAAESADRRVVVCDEPSPTVVHTLFGRLRDEVWQLPLTWLVAGNVNDEDAYLMPPADAFFERVVRLEELSPDEQRQILASRAPELDDGTVETVVSNLTRPPRNLLDRARAVADAGDSAEIIRQWSELEQRVAGLGRPEAMAFAELVALGPVSASDAHFLSRLGWTRERAVQVLGKLERAGFVETFFEHAQRGRPRKMFQARMVR